MPELRDDWGVSLEEADIGGRHIAVAILFGLSLPTWGWVGIAALAWAAAVTIFRALGPMWSAGMTTRQKAAMFALSFAGVGGAGLMVAGAARFVRLAIVALAA